MVEKEQPRAEKGHALDSLEKNLLDDVAYENLKTEAESQMRALEKLEKKRNLCGSLWFFFGFVAAALSFPVPFLLADDSGRDVLLDPKWPYGIALLVPACIGWSLVVFLSRNADSLNLQIKQRKKLLESVMKRIA